MATGGLPPLHRDLLVFPLALASLYGLSFLWVALQRLSFPSEIEWMEGGMVAHAARLLSGAPIYAAPSVDFVPFFYTPGYPALLAQLAPLLGGLSLPLGRAVSLSATCAIFVLLYQALRREGCPPRYALFGPLIYAALFRTCGAFYDLARPDSLALALTLATILLIRSGRSWVTVIAASLLCSVAFLTKQTSAVFFPPLALALATRAPGRALVFTGLTLGLSAGAVLAIDAETDGAFWAYSPN